MGKVDQAILPVALFYFVLFILSYTLSVGVSVMGRMETLSFCQDLSPLELFFTYKPLGLHWKTR